MKKVLQVIIEKEEKYFVGHFINLPIITQAVNLDKLIKNLREAFELYKEDEKLEQKKW